MEIIPLDIDKGDYQYAAELSLFGKIGAPPVVNAGDSAAYLVTLDEPIDAINGDDLHSHVVVIITHGAFGPYAETFGAYAADADGNILGGEDGEPWIAVTYPLASRDRGAFIRDNIVVEYLGQEQK